MVVKGEIKKYKGLKWKNKVREFYSPQFMWKMSYVSSNEHISFMRIEKNNENLN